MAFLNDGTIHLGYNDQPWTFTNSNSDVYTFKADPIRRKLGSFKDECIRAAKEIGEAYKDKPIYVLYSGGIDSEVVFHSFRLAGVPAIAVCIQFEDNLNIHELKYAFQYFERHKVPPSQIKIIPFNERDWLQSAACKEIANNVQTVELGYTHLFQIALDHLSDGVVITGHEEPLVWAEDDPETGKRKWSFYCHERHYSIHKFFMKYERPGVPSFFQWSTELLNSFMHNDYWIALFNNQYAPGIWITEQLKYGFFGNQFNLAHRKKYTSFERLVAEILDADNAWGESLPIKWTRSQSVEIFEWFDRCNVRTIW